MKKLIINADDFGFSIPINEAVEKCYSAGVITGASIMACGEYFNEACERLRALKKREIGVHFTLTGSLKPAAENAALIRSLLSGKDTFVPTYKDFAMLLLKEKISREEIFIELKEQIKKIIASGLKVTHLDSHEHIHMFPPVLEAVMKIAETFNVSYIRMPIEKIQVISKDFRITDVVRYAGLRVFTRGAKKKLTDKNIGHNDAFLGHFHSGRMDRSILSFMLRTLSEGVTELAVHPATASEIFLKESPWYKNAPKELEVLLSSKWKEILEAEKIQLVTHSDIAEDI